MADNPDIVNIGIGGDTTKGLLQRYPRNIANISADNLIIQIGYNDFKFRSLKHTINNYKLLLAKLGFSGKIYMISLFPVNTERAMINKQISLFNRELGGICQNNADYKYIDLHTSLYNANTKGLTASYTYDKVHLNKEGYKFFLAALDSIIINKG
jgi:lysophospholipase L1-like esterase